MWAVVPASGVGRRMGADIPKQYLEFGGRSLLEHSLDRLLSHPRIEGLVLALSPEDRWWPAMNYRSDDKPLLTCQGGPERLHSVLKALQCLHDHLDGDALVLVHDAVRPFLLASDLDCLIDRAADHPDGALLATPVADTLKREEGWPPRVRATEPRAHLWQALTPQAFRFSLLKRALQDAIDQGRMVTDDASAMELGGYRPLLVAGDRRNIKITHPEDLLLAEAILRSFGDGAGS